MPTRFEEFMARPGPDMESQLFMAKLFGDSCLLCKTMLGIEVTHPPAVWTAIDKERQR